ncbi:protein kinase family protein [Candidatus Bathyarchaeota archaeon]|nr:protein kinase family protein [Candidatus Bathyarchaeota archaeon]
MAPHITAWEDLTFFHEDVDDASDIPYTVFAVIDEDDMAYFGKLDHPMRDITLQQLTSALAPVSDEDLFPEWPLGAELTQAQDTLPSNIYVKRPDLALFKVFQEHNVLSLIPKGLLEEAETMEKISKHPHPYIVHYHGCRVRRGRITGLVLDRHPHTLADYLKNQVGSVDKEPFMRALTSAVDHLHSINFAHNDLHPGNILVNQQGMPVLIDFGSSREIGAKLGTSLGTKGWIEVEEMEDYDTSETGHDMFALEKIRAWLDAPTFDD